MFEFLAKKRFRSPDKAIRAKAVLELGRSRSASAAALLVDALEDEEADVRAAAASALASSPDPTVRPTLFRLATGDRSSVVRKAALDSLNASDASWRERSEMKDELRKLASTVYKDAGNIDKLKTVTEGWRSFLGAKELGAAFLSAGARDAKAFAQMLDEIEPQWRASPAARDWVRSQLPRAAEIDEQARAKLDLVEPSWRSAPEIAAAVTTLLSRQGDFEVADLERLRNLDPAWSERADTRDRVMALVGALESATDEAAKIALLNQVGVGGIRAAIPAVTAIYKAENKVWQTPLGNASHEALRKIGADARTFAEARYAAVWVTRARAVESAFKIDANVAAEIAREKLRKDEEHEVRLSAANGLGKAKIQAAVGDLCAALKDSDKRVRDVARWALRTIGSPEALRAIEAAAPRAVRAVVFRVGAPVRDSEAYVRAAAEQFYKDEPFRIVEHRVVGVREPIEGDRAVSLYHNLIREGQVPNFGVFDYKQYWRGNLADGAPACGLFFSS